jgi:hypothetical protein
VQSENNIGFKEWAIVVDALGAGEQIIILRKGGIREPKGQFRLEHDEFFLFPTFAHQNPHAIIPSKRPRLAEIVAAAPKNNTVPLLFYAKVAENWRLDSLEQLHRLEGRHIWTFKTLQERYKFGRFEGVSAIVVRVFRLPNVIEVPNLPQYGGCTSWVEFEKSLSTAGATPVLNDAEFENRCRDIESRIRLAA